MWRYARAKEVRTTRLSTFPGDFILLTNQTRALDSRRRSVQAANHLGDSDAEAAELGGVERAAVGSRGDPNPRILVRLCVALGRTA